jgi:hypothetical protein
VLVVFREKAKNLKVKSRLSAKLLMACAGSIFGKDKNLRKDMEMFGQAFDKNKKFI